MIVTTPSKKTEQLAKDLAQGSLDPKHGLTVPQKILAATKPTKN
jgi:hypothetical protein